MECLPNDRSTDTERAQTDMNKIIPLLATAVLLALTPLALAQQAAPAKKVFCWDAGGRRVCSDAIPASAVNAPRTEISVRSGMKTAEFPRAPTAAERAEAEARERADAMTAAAEHDLLRRDRAMADSYASEVELRRAFQHRITLLDETVKASQLGIKGIRQSLLSLLRQASETELGDKPVASHLSGTIHTRHHELLRQQDLLGQQRQDRAEIESQFQAALLRYREMKATDDGNV